MSKKRKEYHQRQAAVWEAAGGPSPEEQRRRAERDEFFEKLRNGAMPERPPVAPLEAAQELGHLAVQSEDFYPSAPPTTKP